MTKLLIEIGDDKESFVRESVNSGAYQQDAEEVVGTALQMLQSQTEEISDLAGWSIEDLRREVAVGLRELESGEFAEWDIDEIKKEGRRKLADENRTGR
jgi:putative addiction module CopG family antidote